MRVEKKQDLVSHVIRNMTRNQVSGEYQFAWKFQNASHFLIAVLAGTKELDTDQDVLPVLEQRAQELVSAKWLEERGLQLYLVREQEFLVNKSRFSLSRQKLKAQTPYQVAVYPCELGEDSFELYEVSKEEARAAIPVVLSGELHYKTSFFSKQKTCILRIKRMEGYVDGLLACKPSCCSHSFPVSGASIDRELVVILPKDESLDVMVTEHYRQYYNINVKEG